MASLARRIFYCHSETSKKLKKRRFTESPPTPSPLFTLFCHKARSIRLLTVGGAVILVGSYLEHRGFVEAEGNDEIGIIQKVQLSELDLYPTPGRLGPDRYVIMTVRVGEKFG